jgi:hypothetical protein
LSLRNCRLAIIAFVLSWDPDWCQIHVGWKADESSLNFQEIQKYFLHIYQPCAKISALPWQFSAFSLRNHQGTNRPQASRLLKKTPFSSGSLLAGTSFYYPRSATLKKGTAWPRDNEHLSEIITSK